MSADNGIYILESPVRDGDGKEYRVAQCCADILGGTEDPPYPNPVALWYRFEKRLIFQDEAVARQEAQRLRDDLMICEYDIYPIKMDRPFPTFDEALTFAMHKFNDTFAAIENTDQPAKSETLYAIRFSLMDVLNLLIEGVSEKNREEPAPVKPTVEHKTTSPKWDYTWEHNHAQWAVRPSGHGQPIFRYWCPADDMQPSDVRDLVEEAYHAGYLRGCEETVKK